MRTPLVVLTLVFASSLSLVACRDSTVVAPERRSLAVPPPAKRLLGNPIVGITAGANHTCYRRLYGAVFCWGFDADGELGIGPAPATCGTVDVGYPYGPPPYPCASVPTLIPNFTFYAVSAGNNHTCALRGPDRTAWCWGDNAWFQLGTGDHMPSTTPRQVAGTLAFSSISAGFLTSCGTVDGTPPQGTLYCWGHGWSPSEPSVFLQTPTVENPPAGDPANFHLVTVGQETVCAYWFDNATTRTYCMGNNGYGEAGVNPTGGFVPLTQVQQVNPAGAPAVGYWAACVDQAGGGVACWGDNQFGELGNAQAGIGSAVPVAVSSPVPLHGVVVNSTYACALDASGNAWCWGGLWAFGGTTTMTPTMVGGGHTFIALAAGYKHVCGIGSDQHVWCWGDNNVGQLGNGQPGANAPATQPVQASGT